MSIHDIDVPALIESSTLMGDLRDEILKRLRTMPKPWTVMSEAEQQDTIDSIDRVSRHLIIQATALIAANGRATVMGILEKCVFKDGIQLTIEVAKTAAERHAIADAVSSPVLIAIADASMFMGESAPAKPDPDQRNLPIDSLGKVEGNGNVANFRTPEPV